MLLNRIALLARAGIGPTFGVKYEDPAVLPTGNGRCVAFSPTSDAIVIGHSTSPFISAYGWSSNGFGSRYANPSQLPTAAVTNVRFTPSGSHIIYTTQGGTVFAYAWSGLGGFGSRVQSAVQDVAGPRHMAISPSGSHIAIAGNVSTSPRLIVIPWTGSDFGSPVITPPTLAGTGVRAVEFSPDGAFLAAVGVGMGIAIYPFNGTTLGTPFTASTGSVFGLSFAPTGNALAWGGQNGRDIEIAQWSSSGFGTITSNLGVGGQAGIAISPSNNICVISPIPSTPPITAYRWFGSSLGDKFADPLRMPGPGTNQSSLAFTPTGDALAVAHDNSPFITVYKITEGAP